MWIRYTVFAGSIAALAMMTTPVLAKNSGVPKTDDNTPSSSCHAYQQAADGSWTELSCQELGSQGQPQRKSATRASDQETR